MKKVIAILCLLTLYSADAQVSMPELVKDLTPERIGSESEQLFINGDIMYILANDRDDDKELYAVNLKDSTTSLVRNFTKSGSTQSRYIKFYVMNGETYIFYCQLNETPGVYDMWELWKTDGTAEGTDSINTMQLGSFTIYVHAMADKFIMAAKSSSKGFELWESDGTDTGTHLLKDIYAGSFNSSPRYFTEHNGTVYFVASDGNYGREIWKTDGTASGTALAKDVYPGIAGSDPENLFIYKNAIYFEADFPGDDGMMRWSIGASTVTQMKTAQGQNFNNFAEAIVCDDIMYFTAFAYVYGTELFLTQGTQATTGVAIDINPSTGSSPEYISCIDDIVIYLANGPKGKELYRYDRTITGSGMIKELYPGMDEYIYHITATDSRLFFVAYETGHFQEYELYEYSDRAISKVKTISTKDYGSFPNSLIVHGEDVYFSADDDVHGFELWKSNGTESGTYLYQDLRDVSPDNEITDITASPFGVVFNGKDYDVDVFGNIELCTYDYMKDDAKMIVDHFSFNEDHGNPQNLLSTDKGVYYTVFDRTRDAEIMYYDYARKKERTIKSYASNYGVGESVYLDEKYIHVYGYYNSLGELYTYDESDSSYLIISADIRSSGYSYPKDLTKFKNMVVFTATGQSEGRELYKTEGSRASTALVKDINNGGASSIPQHIFNWKDSLLVFSAHNGMYNSIYTSEGDDVSTKSIIDLPLDTTVSGLIPASDYIIYTSHNSNDEHVLWSYEMTTTLSTKLGTLTHGDLNASPELMTYDHKSDQVFFIQRDSLGVASLWITDGTVLGTKKLKSFTDSEKRNEEFELVVSEGAAYFTMINDAEGFELWKSDGTPTGTVIVEDMIAGSTASNPTNLTLSNGYLYFVANHPSAGRELMKMNVSCLDVNADLLVVNCHRDSVVATAHITSSANETASVKWYVDDNEVSSTNDFGWKLDSVKDYTVRLRATSASGCVSTKDFNLKTIPKPHSVFTVDNDTQCLSGNRFTFTNSSYLEPSGKLTYAWDFGDKSTASTKNTYNEYTQSGLKKVVLVTGYADHCYDTASMEVLVSVQPNTSTIFGPLTSKSVTDQYYPTIPSDNIHKWSVDNGEIVEGQNTDTVTIKWTNRPGDGVVYLQELSPEGCPGGTKKFNVRLKEAINSVGQKPISGLSVYPNPTANFVTIDIDPSEINSEVQIYNLLGSEVHNQKLLGSRNRLDFKLAPGSYVIKIVNEERQSTYRLVVR